MAEFNNSPKPSEKISAFFAFHLLLAPPVLLVAVVLLGPDLATRAHAVIVYSLFVFWSGCAPGSERGFGSPWRRFSEGFPPFRTMRSHLGLGFAALPKELVEAEAREGARFVFAAFPHGCGSEFRILMEGMLQEILPNVFRRMRSLSATVLFWIPFVREIALWTGCVDASRAVAELNLDAGNSLLVLPGGEAEQLMTVRGRERVYLTRRKGFVKLAMRKRVPIVPMYVFGSSDLYHTSGLLRGPRHWLVKNLGVCIPLCRGTFGSPVFPLRERVTVVFGAPIEFKMEGISPTEEELDSAHNEFMVRLRCLFDEHKVACGCSNRKLEIE